VLLTERPRAHHKTIISLFPSVHRQTETEMFVILRSVTWCLVAATSDLETSGCFFVVAVGVLLFLQWVTMLVRHQASSL